MLTILENLIVDNMTKTQIRYLSPVLANKPTSEVKEIYALIRRDFQLVPPLTLFSPSKELLAGVWSIWRESQIVNGTTPRSTLEAVAVAVSKINSCPYCVDAHSGMLHALSRHGVVDSIFDNINSIINDDKTRKIVEWALATKKPGSSTLRSPPFSVLEAPELIGTAIVYHFVNRMVNIFLAPSPLPFHYGKINLRRIVVRLFGGTLAKRIVRRKAKAGESIKHITRSDLPPEMYWAIPNIHITSAFINFTKVIEKLGSKYISNSIRQFVSQHIDSWNGEEMGIGTGWVDKLIVDLDNEDRAVAKLALITAFASYQVTDEVINQFRVYQPKDEALLAVTAWASFTTSRRIGSWM